MGDPFLSHRERRRSPRPLVVAAVVAGVVVLGAAAVGGLWLVERGRLPARTTVGGVQVGGLSPAEAREAVLAEVARRTALPIIFHGPDGTASATGRELGAKAVLGRVLVAADGAGALTRVVRAVGLGGTRAFPLSYKLDPVRVEALANRLDARFGDPAVAAAIAIRGLSVSVEPASAGTGIDRVTVAQRLTMLPRRLTLTLGPVAPRVSTAAAETAAARVERLLSVPRTVRHEDVEATLWPRKLASLVVTTPGDSELLVALDADGLAAALRPTLGSFETRPQDAWFEADGDGGWRLVPESAGVLIDGARIGRSLVRDLDSTVHRAHFAPAAPKLTVALAKKLGIKELVSEFTTHHKCCASRVTNIHLGAESVNGTIVLPGEEFSLNEVLGERTVERGFVIAQQILAGRLEDAVGGGVSQIATTVYNAAFFAGVELITHQPHQFYIPRYPMGREATVSWGGPELIWRNDWPAAILVAVATTDTSITVRFFSSLLGREVQTTMSEPSGLVKPKRIFVRNKALAPGTREVVQEAGPDGFSISYTRTVLRDGDVVKEERFYWRYVPEDEIVELGPKKKGVKEPPLGAQPIKEPPATTAAPPADAAAPPTG